MFNLAGGEGIGSYFQDPVQAGTWIHVVGVASKDTTSIYKNGAFRDCDRYTGSGPEPPCHNYPPDRWITPKRGSAPVRIGTRDKESFFKGSIREVRVWNRALTGAEISDLYSSGAVPGAGLVAAYLLDEDVAVDSAESHNGVINGGTWVTASGT